MEPVGEAAPRAVRSVPGFLLSAREHVKVWVRVFAAPPPPSSPRSIRLERGVAKSGREGDPLETNLISSPGQQERKPDQDMPVGGRGRGKKKKQNPRGFQKLHGIHKSHPLDPPLKPDLNLATPPPPPFPAGLPKANVTEHTLQPEPEMLTFQTKARTAVLPGGKQDFLLFLGPVAEALQGLAG